MEVREMLFAYARKVIIFEKCLIENYNLLGHPYNEQSKFPKSGHVSLNNEDIEYSFHGRGCTIIWGQVEIGYDVYVTEKNYITVSPWKFLRFIQTFYHNQNSKQLTQRDSLNYLEELRVEDIIYKLNEEFMEYQIRMDWFESHNSEMSID